MCTECGPSVLLVGAPVRLVGCGGAPGSGPAHRGSAGQWHPRRRQRRILGGKAPCKVPVSSAWLPLTSSRLSGDFTAGRSPWCALCDQTSSHLSVLTHSFIHHPSAPTTCWALFQLSGCVRRRSKAHRVHTWAQLEPVGVRAEPGRWELCEPAPRPGLPSGDKDAASGFTTGRDASRL